MKKFFVVVLALALTVCLVGCGEPKVNKDLSENAVAALEAAIETLDSFLDYDITAEAAEEKLERIKNSLSGSEEFYDKQAQLLISAASTSVFNYGVRERSNERMEAIGGPTHANDMGSVRDNRNSMYDLLYRK